MLMRSKAKRIVVLMGAATAMAATALVVPLSGVAVASPAVTIQGGQPGNPTDGQTVSVSGTGFPVHSADPTGLQIIECADPNGTTANLPTDSSQCDGTTVNPLPVNTDTNGAFTAKYTFAALSTSGSSNINCDATDFCVLWVGVDYNGAFTSNFAFSAPFEIGAPPPLAPETTLVIALPVAGVIAGGGTFFFLRRRRRNHASAAV
jgi:hypothetical protein